MSPETLHCPGETVWSLVRSASLRGPSSQPDYHQTPDTYTNPVSPMLILSRTRETIFRSQILTWSNTWLLVVLYFWAMASATALVPKNSVFQLWELCKKHNRKRVNTIEHFPKNVLSSRWFIKCWPATGGFVFGIFLPLIRGAAWSVGPLIGLFLLQSWSHDVQNPPLQDPDSYKQADTTTQTQMKERIGSVPEIRGHPVEPRLRLRSLESCMSQRQSPWAS